MKKKFLAGGENKRIGICDFYEIKRRNQRAYFEIQEAAQIFGILDALLSLALAASKNRYTKPEMGEAGSALEIKNGRHAVVENLFGGQFVPNDIELGSYSENYFIDRTEYGREINVSAPDRFNCFTCAYREFCSC